MADATPGCPKEMTHGPCGGVTTTLGCEVDDRPCPFANAGAMRRWDGPELDRPLDVAPGSIFGEIRGR